MTQKEAQEVLDELQQVNPEHLDDDAQRLFEAIMKIADDKDKYKMQLKMMADEQSKNNEIKEKMIDILIKNAMEYNDKYDNDEQYYREVEKQATTELEKHK